MGWWRLSVRSLPQNSWMWVTIWS